MGHDPITTVRLQNRFRSALNRGRRQRLWQWIRGRCPHLLSLEATLEGHLVTRRPARVEQIPLREIRGSVGRAADYSADFLPLKASDEDRWVHVAEALEDSGLPPIRVLRYHGAYFVEDGHHRVSALRQLRATSTVAEVVDVVDLDAPTLGGTANYAGAGPRPLAC